MHVALFSHYCFTQYFLFWIRNEATVTDNIYVCWCLYQYVSEEGCESENMKLIYGVGGWLLGVTLYKNGTGKSM